MAFIEPASRVSAAAAVLELDEVDISAALFRPGLPDFSWYIIPKPEKMYQMNTKFTK
jgi:hypothetical protein